MAKNVRSSSVSEDKIILRIDYIKSFFNNIKSSLNIGEGLQICEQTINLLVQSYFHDVERYKSFHNTPYIDGVKQAAITTKWILKMRPVYIHKYKPVRMTEYFGNEILALKLGLVYIEIPPEKIPPELSHLAIYTFKYRKVNEDSLILWFKTLSLMR